MILNSIKVNNTDTNYSQSIFDISEYNSGEKYADLSAALAGIPQDKQKGGMTVRFIQSSDNNYVQYRLISQNFRIQKAYWYSIDIQQDDFDDFNISDEQKNKILSLSKGHIKTKNFNSENTPIINSASSFASFSISDENGYDIVQFNEGHIKTKNFDSRNISPGPSPSGDIPANIQYLSRPAKGKHCFSVNVNCNLFTLENSLTKQDQEINGVDYGYVFLPENYTSTGEPTRLIIYCHGAGASLSDYQNPNSVNYSNHYMCWAKLGFAFMDMYAAPTQFTGSTTELHLGNPTVLQCYRKGYEYVQRHFNIKRDGIFVIGASMGGLSSLQICMSGLFPIIGYVGYCPVCDLYKQAYLGQWSSLNRQYIAQFFNFSGREQVTFTSGHIGTAQERQIFKDNIELWKGFNPILMNADNELAQQLLSYVPSLDDSSSWDAEENLAEAQTYKDLKINFPVPAKIFHCVDDTVVLFRYSKYLVNAIRRGGGRAWFRPLPSGGHGAWASGEDVSVTDINGQSFTMKASTYEAYLFFKRLNN